MSRWVVVATNHSFGTFLFLMAALEAEVLVWRAE